MFIILPNKTSFDVSCKLSQMETIRMKCQILFSGKNMKMSDNRFWHFMQNFSDGENEK